MASLDASLPERFAIERWLGLRECPDGDTKLRLGEAARLQNFRVTRDGNLQKRPGTREILRLDAGRAPVEAVYAGRVGAQEGVWALCGGALYSLWDAENERWRRDAVFPAAAPGEHPLLFGFDDKLYVLSSNSYRVTDGVSAPTEVEGYAPLVMSGLKPNGEGKKREAPNLLTPRRRVYLSPDGEGRSFQLPETGLRSIDSACLRATGESLDFLETDPTLGRFTLLFTPSAGEDSIELSYTAAADRRGEITAQRFMESFNAAQDTRVFLYGDGSDRVYSSAPDEQGRPRADYFPETGLIRVGVGNSPVTGLIRHFSTLFCLKADGAYVLRYSSLALPGGGSTAGFSCSTVNRSIGGSAPGQVQLVENDPVALFGSELYAWRANSAGNLTQDERQAQRISDRIAASLKTMETERCVCFDDNARQEYYISSPDGRTLVWSYAADAWTLYTGFWLRHPFAFRGGLYDGSEYGGIQEIDRRYSYDQRGALEREGIPCLFESGSMAFGAQEREKDVRELWLGVKPEARSFLRVRLRTERGELSEQRTLTRRYFSFAACSFAMASFSTNHRPTVERQRLRARRFCYLKLLLSSGTEEDAEDQRNALLSTATLTSAVLSVQETGKRV